MVEVKCRDAIAVVALQIIYYCDGANEVCCLCNLVNINFIYFLVRISVPTLLTRNQFFVLTLDKGHAAVQETSVLFYLIVLIL